jgi:aldehyde dehydrogenase (NAD+)
VSRDEVIEVFNPWDNSLVGTVPKATVEDVRLAYSKAAAFKPKLSRHERSVILRKTAEILDSRRDEIAGVITLESGLSLKDTLYEVGRAYDVFHLAANMCILDDGQIFSCDITPHGKKRRIYTQRDPLTAISAITPFNHPLNQVAHKVAPSIATNNKMVLKPSEKTPLTALATHALLGRALARFGDAPAGLAHLLLGGAPAGAALVDDARVALVSATGSTAMGRQVGPRVAARFGRALLELGGNNAAIVCPSADLDLTVRGVAFSAMGTAGQRCTTLRRLLVHDEIHAALLDRLRRAYASVRVGDPRESGPLVGPLIDGRAAEAMAAALDEARAAGGTVHGGEPVSVGPGGHYARPALVELPAQAGPMLRETFAPILYVVRHRVLDEAIAQHNAVSQGLSSSIFTRDLGEAERFLSASGSDCGIANVNLGPSGAEIGGAFGGEKETGGGRESGSDAWRSYMRRATNTINYGRTLPLAQGVRFELDA